MTDTNDIVERLRSKADSWVSHAESNCMREAADLIEQQEKALEEFRALKDRLDNGIKYNEELNMYTVRWTERELESAQKAAAEIYEKLNWS